MPALSTSSEDTRALLIEAAARLLAEQGPDGLSARRLAREIGTSTMAVYTHFGGMNELRRAIRADGYKRLGQVWGAVPRTDDPVADLTVAGASYVGFALANPNLYHSMFFELSGDDPRVPLDVAAAGVEFVACCMDAGRFHGADPFSTMWQLWTATHGIVAGALAGMITNDELEERMHSLGLTLYVGFGDERRDAERSIARARRRIAR
jgi:AcrR family transcriptional regulator